MPIWGTLIGLTHEGRPVLGMMDQPYTGERFWSAGETAHFRDRGGNERLIHTRACGSLDDAVLASTGPDMFKDHCLGKNPPLISYQVFE